MFLLEILTRIQQLIGEQESYFYQRITIRSASLGLIDQCKLYFFSVIFLALPLNYRCDQLTSIQLTVAEVTNALHNLAPRNARGPDDIPGTLLKNTTNEMAPSLCQLFNVSLSLGSIHSFWKRTNVSPVFRKDDPILAENYIDQFRCCGMFP